MRFVRIFTGLTLTVALGFVPAGCSKSSNRSGASGSKGNKVQEVTLHAKLSEQRVRELTAAGKVLFQQNSCETCHALDGSRLMGPPLNGIFGRKVTLQDGKTITADKDYLYRSLVEPSAQVVKGFTPGVMPSFANLSERSRVALVYYLRSLPEHPKAEPKGKSGAEPKTKSNSKAGAASSAAANPGDS